MFTIRTRLDTIIPISPVAFNNAILNCWRRPVTIDTSTRPGIPAYLSSFYGKEGFPQAAAYCSSKAAVIAITQAVAKEYAEYDINVNAVCPGIVRTHLWDEILNALSQRTGEPQEQIWEKTVASVPLKRPQTVEDIANVVLFLSSELSRNITGESINITGGLGCD